jgi:hypothetical protein
MPGGSTIDNHYDIKLILVQVLQPLRIATDTHKGLITPQIDAVYKFSTKYLIR